MGNEPNQWLCLSCNSDALGFQGNQQALQANSEADAGGGPSTKGFDEIVQPSASADGVLCAQAAGRDFPHRAGVVVKAAHEGAVDGKCDPRLLKQARHSLEMG